MQTAARRTTRDERETAGRRRETTRAVAARSEAMSVIVRGSRGGMGSLK